MKALKYLVLFVCLTAGAAEIPEYAGIGVVLKAEQQKVLVNHILPDTPAAHQKGLQVGDRILAIAQDKEPPALVTNIAQAASLIRGPKDSTVSLTVISAGEDESKARVVSFVRVKLNALSEWGDGKLMPNGTKAPEIKMTNVAGGASEHLSDYRGKIVVLEFWATWCGPCQTKMAELETYPDKYPDWKGKVVLIAASIDDDQAVLGKHLKEKGWDKTHNVWVGIDARIAYHIDAIPTAYVIGRQGTIVTANPESIPDVVNHALKTGN